MKRILYLTSRLLAVVYTAFIGSFALDTLGPAFSWTALGIHLVPAAGLLSLTWVAWRREFLGGLVFLGLGVLYLSMTRGIGSKLFFPVLLGPLFLIGALFACQAPRTTRWVRETLLAIGIVSLLGLDSAAFHDIAKAEPKPYFEYVVLTASIVVFALGGFWEWRRRAKASSSG